MQDLFSICTPREDVLKGTARDSDYAADLAQVLNGEAPREYSDPATFFSNTYPTEGLKNLLRNVCLRLSGKGGEAASIFRLDTQYGGGKTHSLIALSHAANGMDGVANIEEFIEADLVPKGDVRIAAFDGENADPVNGRSLGHGLKAFTPWGELAYSLAGVEGYEAVRKSDVERVAPGAETISSLFGGEPTLILLDELAVYLRKVSGRDEARQLAPFLTSLFKAVESSPGAVLVFTLAIGKEGKAVDAYGSENESISNYIVEAESVAARKATLIDPTTEHETARVLSRRLFSNIDEAAAREVVDAYQQIWTHDAEQFPPWRKDEDRVSEFANGYPLHPELMSTLTDKLSTLNNFQRVRGMLRLLTQTVAQLWEDKPSNTYAIHLHNIDPGQDGIRNEIVTRLELGRFDPAIRNDVSSNEGGASIAQEIDAANYTGMPNYCSYVAKAALWHTFAFNENLMGANERELRYAIAGPGMDLDFINDARSRFMATAAYLDDRPGIPLRFSAEVNITQLIRRQEQQVDTGEARAQMDDRIREIFNGTTLQLIHFPGGPYDVPDEIGDGRPLVALLNYDAESVRDEELKVPSIVESIFRFKGAQNEFRQMQNNLVYLVADDKLKEDMRNRMVRRLALEAMRQPDRLSQLAEHQQDRIQELYQRSEQELALSIQQCYRHLFFPSRNDRIEGSNVDLGHTAIEIQSASEKPGDGQTQILRALSATPQKLLRGSDHPLAASYVRDNTALKNGELTTGDLRNEFRKDPRLPIMLGDDNFITMVRRGVEESVYVYKRGDLIYGPGDPGAEIAIDQQSFVMTLQYAVEQKVWPRVTEEPPAPPDDTGSPTGPTGGGTSTPPIGGKEPPEPVPGAFRAEAPLKQALTEIWEQAREAKAEKLAWLRLRVFDAHDAFTLMSPISAVSGAEKTISMQAEYETSAGSSLGLEFNGEPLEAQPLREFLEAQFRASSEQSLDTTYTLIFDGGLSLTGDAPEKMTERLGRFASGAAYVEASAESLT